MLIVSAFLIHPNDSAMSYDARERKKLMVIPRRLWLQIILNSLEEVQNFPPRIDYKYIYVSFRPSCGDEFVVNHLFMNLVTDERAKPSQLFERH